ncbi:MAG: bifunctional diaminohydroxyphosphoribosylaminopyrimidine deaminase/5-amino-6-(5-phosphoribosylamino)uracil reductase RibD [Rheinheimera sp.]|nr:bifunctional diaminohydroxyphosphoribosylaminopyrimidine deaminase/5-amino-6-(5-phosphoribosylamino)uracil reductase RibD [Rheinheimera sp.]
MIHSTNHFNAADEQAMRRAIALAELGCYTTAPNPNVGAVLVKGGEIIGEGYHQQAGGPHAEVFALRQAGDSAKGATAYVTLEPCSHFGRTPPCANALNSRQASVGW